MHNHSYYKSWLLPILVISFFFAASMSGGCTCERKHQAIYLRVKAWVGYRGDPGESIVPYLSEITGHKVERVAPDTVKILVPMKDGIPAESSAAVVEKAATWSAMRLYALSPYPCPSRDIAKGNSVTSVPACIKLPISLSNWVGSGNTISDCPDGYAYVTGEYLELSADDVVIKEIIEIQLTDGSSGLELPCYEEAFVKFEAQWKAWKGRKVALGYGDIVYATPLTLDVTKDGFRLYGVKTPIDALHMHCLLSSQNNAVKVVLPPVEIKVE